jgi:hypothetical protein
VLRIHGYPSIDVVVRATYTQNHTPDRGEEKLLERLGTVTVSLSTFNFKDVEIAEFVLWQIQRLKSLM